MLTVKPGETVTIGGAKVSVSRKGGGFKMMIDAPRDVPVRRSVVQKRFEEESKGREAPEGKAA